MDPGGRRLDQARGVAQRDAAPTVRLLLLPQHMGGDAFRLPARRELDGTCPARTHALGGGHSRRFGSPARSDAKVYVEDPVPQIPDRLLENAVDSRILVEMDSS